MVFSRIFQTIQLLLLQHKMSENCKVFFLRMTIPNIRRLLTHLNVFRPSDETLQLLESIGAIKLRYSMTTYHESWILVGYKGKQFVSWITEKIGRIGEAIKIAVSIQLNESKPFIATLDSRAKIRPIFSSVVNI